MLESKSARLLVSIFLVAVMTMMGSACCLGGPKGQLKVEFIPPSIEKDSPSHGIYVCNIEDPKKPQLDCIDYQAFMQSLIEQHQKTSKHANEL